MLIHSDVQADDEPFEKEVIFFLLLISIHLLIQQMRKKSLTSGAYISDFSFKEKHALPTQLKPEV